MTSIALVSAARVALSGGDLRSWSMSSMSASVATGGAAHPERVEEVARARLLLAVVFLEVEEGEDVCVPRLQVHGEGALPLAAALVDETRRVIVDA